MRIFITKYALTSGIRVAEAEQGRRGVMVVKSTSAWQTHDFFHGEGKEYCLTEDHALKVAEELRTKRIAALERQIERVRALQFSADSIRS